MTELFREKIIVNFKWRCCCDQYYYDFIRSNLEYRSWTGAPRGQLFCEPKPPCHFLRSVCGWITRTLVTGSQDFPLRFSFCRPGNLYGSQEPEMNLILAQLKTLPYTNFSLEGKISEAVTPWHPLQGPSFSEDPETGCLDPVPGSDCIKDQFHMVKKKGFLHLSPRAQNWWPVPPSSAGVQDSCQHHLYGSATLGLCTPLTEGKRDSGLLDFSR